MSTLPCTESLKRKTTSTNDSSLSSTSLAVRARTSPPDHHHHHQLSLCLSTECRTSRDDILRALPQNPHLKPLNKYCEGVRQGLKIGLYLVFINLAETFVNLEKLLELSTEDVHKISGQLSDLEEMGYDCAELWGRFDTAREFLAEEKVARRKIEELSSVKKDKKEKESLIRTRISELESELMELEAASKKLEEEVETLKVKEMIYAEERVKILQEWTSVATAPWH